ncbi:MAG TPA: hypothetical protein VKG78_04755 [Opitutaceae bacterium]|nr:hypothetical protein [Opitutaceae bacterium]
MLAMAVGPLFAEANQAMSVQMVKTDSPELYVSLVARINALVKARTGVERLRHVWEGDFAADNSHGIFVVSTFPSAAAIYQSEAKLKDYPELDALLFQLKAIRHLGPSYLYKSVRNEGMYEGGAVYNTGIVCSDEAAYLKALDGLKAIFDANGFTDVKVNLWRIAAGRMVATHLVVLSLPSEERVGELLDAIWDKALMKDWNEAAAKIRTVNGNGTYHEITK